MIYNGITLVLRYEEFAELNAHCFDTTVASVMEHSKDACPIYYLSLQEPVRNFCIKFFANISWVKKKIVLCMALSGTAALLLHGGINSHSRFNPFLNTNKDSV